MTTIGVKNVNIEVVESQERDWISATTIGLKNVNVDRRSEKGLNLHSHWILGLRSLNIHHFSSLKELNQTGNHNPNR